MNWQVLDVGSIWLREFASVLSGRVPTVCWQPEIRTLGHWQKWERETLQTDPPLRFRSFPLQRGYVRFPVSALMPFAPRVMRRLHGHCPVEAGESVLICTTPYWAPVAERWPGTVVYYQTDLTVAYAGANPQLVRAMDRRMCKVARVVCPNSERIADYLVNDAGCQRSKITVVPNATRAANVYDREPDGPGPLPSDVADLQRPVAGVIGNLAANMDWEFLLETVERTPEFSWLFVGPAEMPVADPRQRAARQSLLARAARAEESGRLRFIGSRPYGALQSYARAFDVAVLPYRRQEPTYSGSSTRFYEHLAACRPMVATRGFAELLGKEPLLELAGDAPDAAARLQRLRDRLFRDGRETERWRASKKGTWEERVACMIDAVERQQAEARGLEPAALFG